MQQVDIRVKLKTVRQQMWTNFVIRQLLCTAPSYMHKYSSVCSILFNTTGNDNQKAKC